MKVYELVSDLHETGITGEHVVFVPRKRTKEEKIHETEIEGDIHYHIERALYNPETGFIELYEEWDFENDTRM